MYSYRLKQQAAHTIKHRHHHPGLTDTMNIFLYIASGRERIEIVWKCFSGIFYLHSMLNERFQTIVDCIKVAALGYDISLWLIRKLTKFTNLEI